MEEVEKDGAQESTDSEAKRVTLIPHAFYDF